MDILDNIIVSNLFFWLICFFLFMNNDINPKYDINNSCRQL